MACHNRKLLMEFLDLPINYCVLVLVSS
uniref:Uncharacterized protein n=1 Tax=Arundo donax TaxID=35708 RepID=A0A0A8ZIN5_ARUDO